MHDRCNLYNVSDGLRCSLQEFIGFLKSAILIVIVVSLHRYGSDFDDAINLLVIKFEYFLNALLVLIVVVISDPDLF